MRLPILLVLGLLALLAPAAAAQDAVQLGRLASDQRLVAEQVRRLTKLLETLEQRDRAEGRAARADLLAQAAARLKSVEQGAELASVIEAIAGDLAALRTGSALSAQAEAIQVLEQLLELLLETQMAAEQEQRQVDLQQHIQELEDLRKRQEELRQRNEALQQKAQENAGQKNADQQNSGAEPSAEIQALQEELARLAEQQRKLAEEIAKLGAERRSPRASEAAQHAKQAAEQLDQAATQEEPQAGEPQDPQPQQQPGQPQPQPQQQPGQPQPQQQPGQPQESPPQQASQERAAEEQKQTEEALREAIEQAEQELEQLEQRKRMQELEDVRVLAEQILSAHRTEEDALKELTETRAESLTRAQRARLRQASRAEQDLAAATQNLLVKIETLGASTFPFFLHAIEEDHRRLAAEIGPPRLLADERALEIAADLTLDWETLIDAIRTEEERIRRKMEQQQQQGEQQPGESAEEEEQESPLVNFATELQLLKRMQESLTRDLDWMRKKFESYARAGITADVGEDLQLQDLLERQLELRRQFEDMLARMQEQQAAGTEDL